MLLGKLRCALEEAIEKWGRIKKEEIPHFDIMVPPDEKLGDYATNVAMLIGRYKRESPQKIAEEIAGHLNKEIVEKAEVAGGGFLNLFVSQLLLGEVVKEVVKKGEGFGFPPLGEGKRVQVEFVSANPTGPLSVAHGRGGAIGDVLSNLFQRLGFQVVREYYINDYGSQIDAFAQSIQARYKQTLGEPAEIPPGGYQGGYVKDIAEEIRRAYGDDFVRSLPPSERDRFFREKGVELMVRDHRETLTAFGVSFDSWFSEHTLYEAGKVEKILDILGEKGYTYKQDGALWFRSTLFGDDKDRVLVRSDGTTTYFAADIAYHWDKRERGFTQVIDIWGPDHHGYVQRMQSAMKALGYEEDWLRILIFQVVRLVREGEVIMMSKREGEFVTLRELVEEVGKDAARFFFLTRTMDAPLDFDINLAIKQAPENPVYYVQYAHTRMSSILREAEKRGFDLQALDLTKVSLLKEKEERELIKKLGEFPTVISSTFSSLEPYNLVRYSLDFARIFHNFYEKHRVIGEDPDLSQARLLLIIASVTVLRSVLSLLGVSAPTQM